MFVPPALRCLMKLEWEWKRVAAIRLLRKERSPALVCLYSSLSQPPLSPLLVYLWAWGSCVMKIILREKAFPPLDNRSQSLNTQFCYIMYACAYISWSQTGFASFYKNIAQEYEENPQVCCMCNSMFACICSTHACAHTHTHTHTRINYMDRGGNRWRKGTRKGEWRGMVLCRFPMFTVQQHTPYTCVCVCVCVPAAVCRVWNPSSDTWHADKQTLVKLLFFPLSPLFFPVPLTVIYKVTIISIQANTA
jgi:hypothetical protein